MNKLFYLLDSFSRYFSIKHCPSCNSKKNRLIDTKYLFLRLFECEDCGLYFRHPLEREKKSYKFYQQEYKEKGDSITTYLPSNNELEELKNMSFNYGSDRSILRISQLLNTQFPSLSGLKIIDFGSSWGYMSYQMKSVGFNVQSFEISKPRAHYGNENLGLDIKTDLSEIKGGVDIFFNSHVIEHVPSPSKLINTAADLLTNNGLFLCVCPNGSPEFRKLAPQNFHTGWGQVHPNYLNASFFKTTFKNNPFYITTFPVDLDKLSNWGNEQIVESISGWELVVLAKPNIYLNN